MKIKKQILWDIIGMSEQLSDGYEKPGSPIRGQDLEKFTSVFRRLGSELTLKKRLRVVDVTRFCDAVQTLVVLE